LQRMRKGDEIFQIQFKTYVLVEVSVARVSGQAFVLQPDKVVRLPITSKGRYFGRAVNGCVLAK